MDRNEKRTRHGNKPIGEMLAEAGLVTRQELEEALNRQRSSGERVVNILIAMGALASRQFVEFLADPGGFATIDLTLFDIDPDVIKLVPKEFALENEIVPIDRMGKVLTVAMMCPLDTDVLDWLEEHTGHRVKPLLCSSEDIRASLDRHYGDKPAAPSSVQDLEGPLRLKTAVSMLRQIDSLPALPGTVHRVREMLYDDNGSAAEAARVISRDPSIAAKMLRVANSAAYGLPRRVDNLQLAVALLGLMETYSVVMSSAIIDIFSRSRTFDYMTFWVEAMVCATTSTALARAIGDRNHTGIFSAGLLHDLGRVALAEVIPRHYGRLSRQLVGHDLIAAEEHELGLIHTEAGYQLALRWDLPVELAETIRFHHNPAYASEQARAVVSMVNIADVLSRAHRPDSPTREVNFEECRESLQYLGLAEELVLEIFEDIPEPETADSLWSPN